MVSLKKDTGKGWGGQNTEYYLCDFELNRMAVVAPLPLNGAHIPG